MAIDVLSKFDLVEADTMITSIGTAKDTPTLEVMPEAFFKRTITVLMTFRAIGHYCKTNNTNIFKYARIGKLVHRTSGTISNRMDDVSDLFRRFFKDHRGVSLLADDDEGLDKEAYKTLKLFERVQGVPSMIYPHG